MILDMIDDDDAYVQSILPLQWRFVGTQVRSLQGVKPDGHEELVRHRLKREYLLQIFVVVEIFGKFNVCCTGSNQMDTKSWSGIG